VAADADAAGGAQSPWVEKRAVVAADANTAGGVGGGDPVAVGEEAGGGGEWEAAAWVSTNSEVAPSAAYVAPKKRLRYLRDRTGRQNDGPTLECRTKKCPHFVLFSV